MPTLATRSAILLAAACATATPAAEAQAQSAAPAAAQRYMSWSGRPATTRPASVIAAEARAQAQGAAGPTPAPTRRAMIPRQVAPTQAVSRPTMQPTPTPQRVSRGPTPASAWLDPQPVPAFAPGAPDPIAYTRETPALVAAADTTAQPAWVATPAPQPRRAQPDLLPAPTVAAPPASLPPAPPPPAADPMAPRADALIFQLRPQTALHKTSEQAGQAEPRLYAEAAAPPAAPVPPRAGQQTSRYYSVHREAGHAPDRTPLPEAVFYDSVALDLAQPPEPEPPLRDAQGRLRPPVRDEDPERP